MRGDGWIVDSHVIDPRTDLYLSNSPLVTSYSPVQLLQFPDRRFSTVCWFQEPNNRIHGPSHPPVASGTVTSQASCGIPSIDPLSCAGDSLPALDNTSYNWYSTGTSQGLEHNHSLSSVEEPHDLGSINRTPASPGPLSKTFS